MLSHALQEGAAAFMSSREAQQAAQAVQDAARHFEQTTQSMLSTPEAKRTASSIEAAATAVHDGTANFVQSGQVLLGYALFCECSSLQSISIKGQGVVFLRALESMLCSAKFVSGFPGTVLDTDVLSVNTQTIVTIVK